MKTPESAQSEGNMATTAHLGTAGRASQRRIGPPYDRTRYILFHWEDNADGTYFRSELEKLQAVFEHFGFRGALYGISTRGSKDATDEVRQQLSAFQKGWGDDNELLIVVYGGHGEYVLAPNRLHWRSAEPYFVDWNKLQEIIFRSNKDVLVLLDCCYAGAAELSTSTARKDNIAACAYNGETPERVVTPTASPLSFTKLATQAFGSFGAPFTVHALLVKIRGYSPNKDPVYWSKRTTLPMKSRCWSQPQG
ncbi:hypothetical protein LTR36_004936 [Oleoguttula mirabilis]|uniref:Caspase family protein n=1 Tax=Oleoguttula mirabilis TaxID=1507867 RepID=A0AAV9JVN0_9PEZI|nr:hypothetical protein LTR36_004936 [Oleoguttula mirabilis]